MLYFFFAIGIWISILCYLFNPEIFRKHVALYELFALSEPIALYRYFHELIKERNSPLIFSTHYIFPLLCSTATWLFYPILLKELSYEELFKTELIVFILPATYYSILILKELYTYNLTQQVTHPHHRVILSDWATLLLCLLFIQFTFNIVPLFTPDTQFPRWCVMVFLLLVIEVLVLLYSSMPKGKSLFRYVHIYRQNATYNSDKDESITTPPTFKVPLTKAYFEEIFIQEKLYLNPQLTTGDLLKRFQIDQPTFSAFIRSTYSMRFSKLLNKLRMEEIERLMAGGKFNEQDIEELIRKAGFSSKRSYYRYRQESMTEVPTSPANKKKTQITLSSHSTERIEQFREKFEAYIHNQKPYLNPELKASDLLVAMGTNRQYFSVFINQVYGMNFSAYINSLRQQEMDTLRQEKSKQGLSEMELALHAGFPSYRTYLQYIRNNKGHT